MKTVVVFLIFFVSGLINYFIGYYFGYKDGLKDSRMQLNARVADYPVCDYLNNALRYLCSNKNIYRYKTVRHAVDEIIYAMREAGCAIYTDIFISIDGKEDE